MIKILLLRKILMFMIKKKTQIIIMDDVKVQLHKKKILNWISNYNGFLPPTKAF